MTPEDSERINKLIEEGIEAANEVLKNQPLKRKKRIADFLFKDFLNNETLPVIEELPQQLPAPKLFDDL